MQNKRMMVILGFLVLLVGAAAFIGGRMLNRTMGPMGLGMPMGNGEMVSYSIQVEPAPELPTKQPEVIGPFIERKDNSIILSSLALEAGGRGVAVGPGSPVDMESGPKVEVVVTGETTVYIETTEFREPPSDETQVVQQTVAEGSLDDLTSQSFVTVWGRKSGDRIIAEIVFISNPVMIQRP